MSAPASSAKPAGKARPLGLADSPLAHAIARKLLGYFLMLVAAMLFTQISFNLFEQIRRLNSQTTFIGHAYLPMASTALWSFDDAQLNASARVLMQHEEVVGVVFRYVDASKNIIVIRHGKTPQPEDNARLENEEQSQLEILNKTGWHRFPVFYEDERQSRLLVGEMTLFINTQLVLKRHAYATLVIVISWAASIFLMWLIIRSVLNSNLAQPLRILVIKLLQIQHLLPEGEVSPDDVRKLRIERFGSELKLLEKQLEKIVMGGGATVVKSAKVADATGADPVKESDGGIATHKGDDVESTDETRDKPRDPD